MKSAFLRDLLTGITTLAGLVGLVAMLWLFGELKDVGVTYYEFTVRLNVATGLTPTSPVALNGVRVGTVKTITLADDPAQGAFVRLKVKEGTKVPENFKVYLDRGFVGETTLQLEIPKDPGAPPILAYVKPGDTFERHASTLLDTIKGPLEEPLAKIALAAEAIDKLATTYDNVGQEVKAFFEPRSTAEVDSGRPPNLPSTLARVDQAVASANQWLADAALRDQTKGLVTKADRLLDTSQQTVDQAAGTLQKVGAAAEELTKLSAAVNSGDGTLGQLVKNPDLYNSLNDAATRLERALVELQVLLEKYRSEGIPLRL